MSLPIIHTKLPRRVRALHQIEITSRCNLRCVYCPSPKLGRPKVDMDRHVFAQALRHAAHHVEHDGQNELNLAGIGESTIHPDFVYYVGLARAAVGDDVKLIFATNGVLPKTWAPELEDYSERARLLALALSPFRPEIWVSLHRPELAALAARAYQDMGLLGGVSVDPSINSMDWAGQVKWPVRQVAAEMPCQWLREGKAFALADGRVSTCCYDATGEGVIGLVSMTPGTIETSPWKLCKSCDQTIGVAGYDQRGGSK